MDITLEITKSIAPLFVSILIVFLNNSHVKKRIKLETKERFATERAKDLYERSFEFSTAGLTIIRLMQSTLNGYGMALLTKEITAEVEKELEGGTKIFSQEIIRLRAIALFAFPQVEKDISEYERLNDETMKFILAARFGKLNVNKKEIAERLQEGADKMEHLMMETIRKVVSLAKSLD